MTTKKFYTKKRVVTGGLLTVSLFLGTTGIAAADSFDSPHDSEEMVDVVLEANDNVDINTSLDVDMTEIPQGAEVVTSEIEAAVLDDSENVVVAVSAESDTPAHTMLLPDSAEDISVEDGMAVVEPATMDDVSFAVSASDEGSMRVYSVLEGRASAERYDYEFPDADMIFADDETGTIYITQLGENGDIEIIGVLEAPWAVDANGVSVPTYFEINGTTVTQVVKHKAGNYAYPIVADPDWWDNVKNFFAKAGKTVKNWAYSAARWLGKKSKWLAGKAWTGIKWVAGKGKVFAKRTVPGAVILCAVQGGWAYYRSDASGWVRVGDAVMGCFG